MSRGHQATWVFASSTNFPKVVSNLKSKTTPILSLQLLSFHPLDTTAQLPSFFTLKKYVNVDRRNMVETGDPRVALLETESNVSERSKVYGRGLQISHFEITFSRWLSVSCTHAFFDSSQTELISFIHLESPPPLLPLSMHSYRTSSYRPSLCSLLCRET